MVIIQVNYEVPADIAAKLATRELIRLSSVAVRDGKEIVLHIYEAQLPAPEEGLAAAMKVAKAAILKNPKASVVIGVTLAAGGVFVWSAKRRKKNKVIDPEVPVSVTGFREALAGYLEAVQSGSLDPEIIDRLISALDAVSEDTDSGNMTIEFSTEQLSALVDLVADYTHEFASANDIDLVDSAVSIESPATSPIVDLRRRLESQQQVFNEAA